MLIGIDLGATEIKGVVLNEERQVIRQASHPTEDAGQERRWMTNVIKVYQELSAGSDQYTVGLSAPGIAAEHNDCILYMPGRLLGLEGLIWSDYLGATTSVLNDANAAMIAESRLGAARGYAHAIMLTLGTGVGGSILIRGELYTGYRQVAGHLGHISVDRRSDRVAITGMIGSLEDAIGNATVSQRTLHKYQSTKELVADVQAGDALAIGYWRDSIQALAVAIASYANVLSPEVVVLGGGIMQAGELLLDPLGEYLDLYEWRPGGKRTKIVTAMMGAWSGAIGAAIFAQEKRKP
ncbi:MAG: ROK family protein [Saprospiraceae bacterium]|nr:ROK family protein [Saprospiraceae bacterium]